MCPAVGKPLAPEGIKLLSRWVLDGGNCACGGGIRGGHVHGATDDFCMAVTAAPVTVHDLHATLLHQLEFDHRQLVFHHQGRDFRLTDVEGHLVRDILL